MSEIETINDELISEGEAIKLLEVLYEPCLSHRYEFITLPQSDEEKFDYFVQKELAKSDIVAEAAIITGQEPDVAARRNFRHGIFRVQSIYRVLPALRYHPARRLSNLAQDTINEFRDGKWDEEFSEEEIKHSIEALITIRALISMSLREYPGKMDTDLIQEAFREADTVRAGIFLGNAAVHRNSTWTYYFPDVEKISTEEEGV